MDVRESFSSCKSYKKRKINSHDHPSLVSISLESLPEDILLQICLRVAANSLRDIENLQLVSKSFLRLCNLDYVLQRHPKDSSNLPIMPCFDHDLFDKFIKKLRKARNPEAILRKGLHHCFYAASDQQQRDKGIKYIAEAAEKGHELARYVYGIILMCDKGENKQKGIKILSSLTKPMLGITLKQMDDYYWNYREHMWTLWMGGVDMMTTHLRRSYVRENCKCCGQTKMWFEKHYHSWNGLIGNDIPTSSACMSCVLHEITKLFFDIWFPYKTL